MGRISGVYKIENVKNGDFYIGGSINIKNRWSGHKSHFRKNIHTNPRMQNVWNKYGESIFEFSILEITKSKKKIIEEREQHYIDELNPVYNVRRIVTDFSHVNGENVNTSKLMKDDVLEIRKRAADGESCADISDDYPNVHGSTINNIIRGITWKDVGGEVQDKKASFVSKKDVLKIRELWASGDYTYQMLSEMFGRHKRTIARIVLFDAYRKYGGKRVEKNTFNHSSKRSLSDEQVRKILRMLNSDVERKEICKKFNISKHVLSAISLGKTYKHVDREVK